MKFKLQMRMHTSGDFAHWRSERCEEHGFYRSTLTPVISSDGWCKKFGRPIRHYRFDGSDRWLSPHEFTIAFLQKLGEPWAEYQERVAIAKESRRKWRRNRHRAWLNPIKFLQALPDPEQAQN